MPPDPDELWRFLPLGYALSIALETPVLVLGLSPRHSLTRKLLAGVWLTACTYPIVVLVLPQLIWRPLGEAGYWPYVAVAEVFAPAAECLLFWLAFWGRESQADAPGSRLNDDSFNPEPEATAIARQKLPTPSHSTAARYNPLRDLAAIIAANLCSFLVGMWLFTWIS